jgi:hypothetical protein
MKIGSYFSPHDMVSNEVFVSFWRIRKLQNLLPSLPIEDDFRLNMDSNSHSNLVLMQRQNKSAKGYQGNLLQVFCTKHQVSCVPKQPASSSYSITEFTSLAVHWVFRNSSQTEKVMIPMQDWNRKWHTIKQHELQTCSSGRRIPAHL